MTYKKDQGRYARMAAFWALFLLIAWGCLRPDGLVRVLRGWVGEGDAWIDPFPLLGKLDLAMAIALGVVALFALVLHRLLNRPKSADMLIETESELRKVTWPTPADTWQGTIAVVFTVAFMLVYLTGADIVIRYVMVQVLGSAG